VVKSGVSYLHTKIIAFVDMIVSHRIIFFLSYSSLNPDKLFTLRKRFKEVGCQIFLVNSKLNSYGVMSEMDFLFSKSSAYFLPFVGFDLTQETLPLILSFFFQKRPLGYLI